jgi:hypothetical protein
MPITDDLEAAAERVVTQGRFDPYLQFVEMPHTKLFYPLGFPLRVSSNSRAIVEAAEEIWGEFGQEMEMPAIKLQLGALEDGSTECPPAPVSRAHGCTMVRIGDAGNFYVADMKRGHSFGWVTSAALAHRSYLRYHYLEAAALIHIANRYSVPVHAACVELDGSGVMLCGESGAGKSSLAFACARAGWTYVTDDSSFLVHGERERRVHGNCHMIRMRPSASELFEEISGRAVMQRAAGKPSIEIPLSAMPEIRRATRSNVDFVVFLNRGSSTAEELLPHPEAAFRGYLHKHLCGAEELHEAQMATVERLLTARVFELRYQDLDWAVGRLERLVRERR